MFCGLTCAEGEDERSGTAYGYETPRAGENVVGDVEELQSDRVEAFGLVAVATLGAL